MNATTIGVDLAKNVFEIAVADEQFRIVDRQRLSRNRFAQFFANRPRSRVVMETCGSAHHWARTLASLGHDPVLLPAHYVRAYVRRNKTDHADAGALIEAVRCDDLRPVPVKSPEQQAIQHLHRLRTQWVGTRNARITMLRGFLREAGITVPVGAHRGLAQIRTQLAVADNGLPDTLRPMIAEVLAEIQQLKERIQALERQLDTLTSEDPIVQKLQSVPGVGPLTATALRAAVVDIQRFPSGRHLSAWLGLTAREHSSGERRRLGRISKRGDVYLRTLLIHCARAMVRSATLAAKRGQPTDRLRTWALETVRRCGYNKATVAVANKLARIIWATWRHERRFDGNWAAAT